MKRLRRGFTMIEMLVAMAIMVAVGFIIIPALHHQTTSMTQEMSNLQSVVADAQTLARSSGDGSTIVFVPNGTTSFTVYLMAGRPDGRTLASGQPIYDTTPAIDPFTGEGQLTSNVAGASRFAIFVSPQATASAASWSSAIGAVPTTMSSEPACTTAISITITIGSTTQTKSIDCNEATLQ